MLRKYFRGKYALIFIAGILVVLGVVFTFIAVSKYYSFWDSVLEVRTLDSSFLVSDNKIGPDLNASALTFGYVPLGGSSTRRILLWNSYPYPVNINLYAKEPLDEYFTSEPLMNVQPGESSAISVTVHVPYNTTIGNYSGKVVIRITKA